MNIGLVVNANGRIALVHDEPFESAPYYIGYHVDKRRIEIFFNHGDTYPISWEATDEMHNFLLKINKILIIRMENKEPVEGFDTSVLFLRKGIIIGNDYSNIQGFSLYHDAFGKCILMLPFGICQKKPKCVELNAFLGYFSLIYEDNALPNIISLPESSSEKLRSILSIERIHCAWRSEKGDVNPRDFFNCSIPLTISFNRPEEKRISDDKCQSCLMESDINSPEKNKPSQLNESTIRNDLIYECVSFDNAKELLDIIGREYSNNEQSFAITRMRKSNLPFYERNPLYELEYRCGDATEIQYIIPRSKTDFVVLGHSDKSIFQLNKKAPIKLDEKTVISYIKFLFRFGSPQLTKYIFVEKNEDVPWMSSLSKSDNEVLKKNLKPLTVKVIEKNDYILDCTLLFSNDLYHADIIVARKEELIFDNEQKKLRKFSIGETQVTNMRLLLLEPTNDSE